MQFSSYNSFPRSRRLFLALIALSCWLAVAGNVPACFAQTTYFSRQSGAWNALASWSTVSHAGAAAASLPGAADTVIVGAGHLITLNQDAAVHDARIDNGTLRYDNIAARQFTVNGNLRIGANGVFTVQTVGAGLANYLLLRGNVHCDGVWTMRPNPSSDNFRVTTVFLTPALQTLRGAPIQASLYRVLLNKASRDGVVDCAFSVSLGDNAGTLENIDFSTMIFGPIGGTWRQSAGTLTFGTAGQRIEASGAVHITGEGRMMFGQNGAGATLTLDGGELLINTANPTPSRIGIAPGNSLLYAGSVDRSSFVLERGTLEVAGRFSRNNAGNIVSYRQTGGILIVGAAGAPNIAARGTFEAVNAASEFVMTGGAIILRHANASVSINRPADFFLGLGASASMTGGMIQFGDETSAANQAFNWSVPSAFTWANVRINHPSARLHPFDAAQNLRLAGDMTVNGIFDGSQTRTGAAAASTLTFQGTNSQTQMITGFGSLTAHHLTMNRQGAGDGAALALMPIGVLGTLNFRETGAASETQTLELGLNADLTVRNSSPNAVQNAAPTRSVRTIPGGGRLFRDVSASGGEYLFPLSCAGSALLPAVTYTPIALVAGGGAGGRFGARVSVGANATQTAAHAQLPSTATMYARRVWSCLANGASGTARIIPRLGADFQDIVGVVPALQAARYRPDETTSGGEWFYADTSAFAEAVEWSGDWSYIETQNRVFYSRASGLWTDAASWSFASHTGAPAPAGVFPSRTSDTVVIGGGMNGMNNHYITLNATAIVGATRLGTSETNTGTLEIAPPSAFSNEEIWLGGGHFSIGARSTLRIGSPDGVSALPAETGAVRTRLERSFAANARYDYIGGAEQRFGSGLPAAVYALGVNKTPASRLVAESARTVWNILEARSGALDLQNFTLFCSTVASVEPRAFTLGDGARLRIAGGNGFADATTGAVRGFEAYNIDAKSVVEFYGEAQSVANAPTGDAFGFVGISGSGVKTAWQPLVIRADLNVENGATFVNNSRGTGMRVEGSLRNAGLFLNNGVLEIGKP
jgi:hypothetical protein